MSDCRLKYATDISDDIKEIAGVGRTSARAIKANQILLPVGGLSGDNKSLSSKTNTLEWAKQIKKKVDEKYNAKAFGSLIELDNNKYNGTLINIIVTSRILDAYEIKNGQKPMAQLTSTVDKKNDLTDRVYTLLEDYMKANGIKVEYLDSLKKEYNYDPIAVFDSVNQVVKINKGEQRPNTLPEELAHHITTALGEDHVLVKRAMNLIGRLNYKQMLGQEYVDLYNNDTKLLKMEFLGKIIASNIVDKTIPKELDDKSWGEKLWETVNNIVKAFIKLFKSDSNTKEELQSIIDELSTMMISGAKINPSPLSNPIQLFQLNGKNKVPKEFRDQYVYYKGLIKKLKKEINELASKENPDLEKIKKLEEKIVDIDGSLKELIDSGNKQLLLNLASTTLNEVEDYINTLNKDKEAGKTRSYDNIENTVKVLNMLSELHGNGIGDRTKGLKNRLKEHIKDFTIWHVNKYATNKIKDIDFEANEKDIFIGESNFGTLSDVNNYLAKTVGFTIKEAQAAIERENKNSFNKLKKELDALQKYNDKAGISKKDSFKIFIQEYGGTTVLTREYTSKFYEDIKKSFAMDEEKGRSYRKSIATYDFENRKWIPKDNAYKNRDYEKIQKTPELKRFHDFFSSTIKEISNELPVNLSENFIPNIVENSLLDVLKSDSGLMGSLKEGITNILDIYDVTEDSADFIKDEHLSNDTIPLKYIGKISPDKKSDDLGTALLKFMYFSNSYKHMSEILPKTRLLQSMIKEQSFLKNSDPTTAIEGEKTNLYGMVDAFINMQVKGKMKSDNDKVGNFNYGNYIDFGLKYTSLLRIGLNPFNALTNVLVGNIGNIIEAVGGRNFTYREYNKARKIFFQEAFNSDSKLNKLIEVFNPLMELEDYENLNKVNIGSSEYKEKIESIMYSPQRMGEKLLQTSTMIASLLHDKITTKDGKQISTWEAFKEDGIWNEELVGYKLTDDMIFKTTNKVQRINQMIHGRYSQKDATKLSQYALFRAAFQFKKWIPSAIEMRFGEKRFDDRLGMEVEGRYKTYVKWFLLKYAQLKSDAEKLEKYKFTDTDTYNMRKNIAELVIMLSSILMYKALGWDDKDKRRREGWYKFTLDQLDRVSGDMLFWYNPAELNRTASNPVPLLKTHKDLIKVITSIPYAFDIDDSEYKRGRKKGENKFLSALIDATPVAKPLADVIRTMNKEPYQERTNR